MSEVALKIFGTGLLYFSTVVFGFWLSNAGRPLNSAIFTFHKLIAVATFVLLTIVIINFIQNVDINAVLFTLILITGLSALVLLATGILLSFENLANNLLVFIHNVSVFATVISASATIYVLVS